MPHAVVKHVASPSLARAVSSVYISLEEWDAMPPIKSQRNHEKRSYEPVHIKKFSEPLTTHMIVHAAVLPNGDIFKLDGHTRNEIWKFVLQDKAPTELLCLMHAVEDIKKAKKLYLSIDSKRAVKTTTDEIFSAFREGGFTPISPLIASCKFNEAMTIAAKRAGRGYDKMDQVRDMLPVLKSFDSLLPTPAVFVTPIAAAAMLSIMRDKENALPFWSSYAAGTWDESSAIAALDAYINATDKEGNRITVWGKRADNIQVTGRCLSLYLLWAANPSKTVDATYPFGKSGETIVKTFKAALPS